MFPNSESAKRFAGLSPFRYGAAEVKITPSRKSKYTDRQTGVKDNRANYESRITNHGHPAADEALP